MFVSLNAFLLGWDGRGDDVTDATALCLRGISFFPEEMRILLEICVVLLVSRASQKVLVPKEIVRIWSAVALGIR